MVNPWGLSPLIEQALDALIERGGQKEAARKLGISVKAVMLRTEKARKKMEAPGRIRYLILWDRFRQTSSPSEEAE